MRVLLTAAVLFLAACSSPSEPDDRWAVPENITFATTLGIDLAQMNKTDSGLYWQDMLVGTGAGPEVVLDDVVWIHYTIWLPDGRSVKTTRGGAPEQQKVLLFNPGLAEGVTGMLPGGIRKLVVRPELAYPNGNGPIPALTTIVYEVELIGIQR